MLSSASRTSSAAGCQRDLAKSATTPLYHGQIYHGQIADDRHLTGPDSKLLVSEHMTLAVAFRRAAQKLWRVTENSQSASECRTKKT